MFCPSHVTELSEDVKVIVSPSFLTTFYIIIYTVYHYKVWIVQELVLKDFNLSGFNLTQSNSFLKKIYFS